MFEKLVIPPRGGDCEESELKISFMINNELWESLGLRKLYVIYYNGVGPLLEY